MRFRAAPRGTPAPDGDRRFAEREFPLLEPLDSQPRLAVTVGREFPIAVADEAAPFLFRGDFIAQPVRSRETVEIEGERVELDVLRDGDRWLGQGPWKAFTVEIHAIGVEPGDVRLRVAGEIPACD